MKKFVLPKSGKRAEQFENFINDEILEKFFVRLIFGNFNISMEDEVDKFDLFLINYSFFSLEKFNIIFLISLFDIISKFSFFNKLSNFMKEESIGFISFKG